MLVNIFNFRKVNRTPGEWLRLCTNPGICYLCSNGLGPEDVLICSPCNKDLPLNLGACRICALPVTGKGLICGSCLQLHPRIIENTHALYRYLFPVNRLIHDLKFHARLEVAAFLGRCMAQCAREQGLALPQCFVPVPLHKSRVIERGYNQSLEIARAVAGGMDLPLNLNLCNRTINTPPQTTMSAASRRANLKGAFALSAHRKILPEHVVLIDDVITTGATVNELARVLRRGGIKRVDVWAVARAG